MKKNWSLILGIIAAVISIVVGIITISEKLKNKNKQQQEKEMTPLSYDFYANINKDI